MASKWTEFCFATKQSHKDWFKKNPDWEGKMCGECGLEPPAPDSKDMSRPITRQPTNEIITISDSEPSPTPRPGKAQFVAAQQHRIPKRTISSQTVATIRECLAPASQGVSGARQKKKQGKTDRDGCISVHFYLLGAVAKTRQLGPRAFREITRVFPICMYIPPFLCLWPKLDMTDDCSKHC